MDIFVHGFQIGYQSAQIGKHLLRRYVCLFVHFDNSHIAAANWHCQHLEYIWDAGATRTRQVAAQLAPESLPPRP